MVPRSDGGMLLGMQQAMHTTTPANTASFAGILAAMSAPAKKAEVAWDDDGLEDDVATLSYEKALRAHARYRRADGDEPVAKKAVDPGPIRIREVLPAEFAGEGRGSKPRMASENNVGTPHEFGRDAHEIHDRDLKRASVTVRLSATECAQLRERANEAGLTISGYLRSCTFEAEALRAQVKEALAELRTGTSPALTGSKQVTHSWRHWFLRPFAHIHRNQRAAQV